MVDSGDVNRLAEAKDALIGIVQHDKMKGKPLLVFANKQDKEEPASEDQVNQELDLQGTLGEHFALSRVVGTFPLCCVIMLRYYYLKQKN